ncbi:MAG: hypothetical protein WAM82_06635 [Thermoanaerobaculia bacterium]
MIRGLQYILHVVGPLLIGGIIYMIWRAETLQMFRWFEFVHLESAIYTLREMYGGQGGQLPTWLLYSLPDAAWTYSLSMYMGLLWIDTSPRVAFSLAAIGPTLGIGAELGQALRIVPGTFDLADILLSAAAFIVSIMVLFSKKEMSR